MGKFFLTACLFASFMYGSQAQGFGQGEYDLEQPGESQIVARLENDLKDIRLDLERLNVTHEIPGICSICKWVLRQIMPKVSVNTSKLQLKSLLNQACGSYVLFGWLCRKFVSGYIDIIYDDIENKHMNVPKLVCKAMHLCWWPKNKRKQLV